MLHCIIVSSTYSPTPSLRNNTPRLLCFQYASSGFPKSHSHRHRILQLYTAAPYHVATHRCFRIQEHPSSQLYDPIRFVKNQIHADNELIHHWICSFPRLDPYPRRAGCAAAGAAEAPIIKKSWRGCSFPLQGRVRAASRWHNGPARASGLDHETAHDRLVVC